MLEEGILQIIMSEIMQIERKQENCDGYLRSNVNGTCNKHWQAIKVFTMYQKFKIVL